MKIPNKRELKQIVHNHSSDIDSKVFINIYKKWIAKPCSFLFIDDTVASGDSLHYIKNLLEGI